MWRTRGAAPLVWKQPGGDVPLGQGGKAGARNPARSTSASWCADSCSDSCESSVAPWRCHTGSGCADECARRARGAAAIRRSVGQQGFHCKIPRKMLDKHWFSRLKLPAERRDWPVCEGCRLQYRSGSEEGFLHAQNEDKEIRCQAVPENRKWQIEVRAAVSWPLARRQEQKAQTESEKGWRFARVRAEASWNHNLAAPAH